MVDEVRVCRLCESTITVAWRLGWDEEATGRKVWLCNPCGLRWSSSRRRHADPKSKRRYDRHAVDADPRSFPNPTRLPRAPDLLPERLETPRESARVKTNTRRRPEPSTPSSELAEATRRRAREPGKPRRAPPLAPTRTRTVLLSPPRPSVNVSFPPRPRRDRASGPGSKLSPGVSAPRRKPFVRRRKIENARPRRGSSGSASTRRRTLTRAGLASFACVSRMRSAAIRSSPSVERLRVPRDISGTSRRRRPRTDSAARLCPRTA